MDSFNTTGLLAMSVDASRHPSASFALVLILFAVVLLTIASCLQATRILAHSPHPTHVQRLSAVGLIASVVLYCYVADRTFILPKIPKQSDESTFLFFCLVGLVAGGISAHRTLPIPRKLDRDSYLVDFDLLPRQQTEEWKGWMQIVILLYHYFGMSKVLHVYRIIRVLVGSYLFMTTYGHTVYFLRTNDFSLRRFSLVLIRLNLLTCLLAFAMGTKYDHYYFPALSTFWFLITWITIPKTSRGPLELRPVILRVLAACLTIELILLAPGVWDACADFLRFARMPDFDTRELVFRLSLDRYVPHIGMLTACANEQIRRRMHLTSSTTVTRRTLHTSRGVATCLCALGLYVVMSNKLDTKENSNRAHPFTELVPVLVFVLIRNSTPALRSSNCRIFSWFGRYSLETFILQYHIWMASDTKKLLSLGVLSRSVSEGEHIGLAIWFESCLLTGIFILAAYSTGTATNFITSWVVGPSCTGSQIPSMLPSEHYEVAVSHWNSWITRRASQVELKHKMLLLLLMLWLLNIMS